MKKIIIGFLMGVLFLVSGKPTIAQDSATLPQQEFLKAKVILITNQGEIINETGRNPFQDVKLKIIYGEDIDKEIVVEYGKGSQLTKDQLVSVGQTVIVEKTSDNGEEPTYQITDRYRVNNIIPVILTFFLFIIVLSRWKGVGSIAGMAISLATITGYIVPQIIKGANPLEVSIIGCLFIMVTTIYLAHGFSKKTTIAVISTFITLVGIGLISSLLVKLTFLTGLGNEDAMTLKFGPTSNIDFKGLLLGGILIGALGVLDDVTTGLTAGVFELFKANPKQKFTQLFSAGISIGQEHISSLVNTLVLAYAGASMPIFILIVANPVHYPLWLILNDGLIMEEVVRTLAGSIGLVAAVPLTTLMASFYLTNLRKHTLPHAS